MSKRITFMIDDDVDRQLRLKQAETIQFGKKLKTARNGMFAFAMYGDVPSTNNDTENSVRKCIMQRNVRGQMKSNQGTRMLFYVFLTCFETWRIMRRRLNVFLRCQDTQVLDTYLFAAFNGYDSQESVK